MDNQRLIEAEDTVMTSSLCDLTRSFNDQSQQASLSLELKFPWKPASATQSPWIDCPELIQVNAIAGEEFPVVILDDFDGTSLAQLMDQHALTTHQAFTILRQVATALDHLHGCHLVHGALRPSSILVGEAPSLRIVDWMVDWNSVSLRHLPEAAEYLSPERLSNSPAGPQADQFALGVIAHRLLLGQDPFPGRGVAEKLFRIRYGLLNDVVFGENDVRSLAIFERVFDVDPNKRFDSCSAFVEELEKVSPQRYYAETRLLDADEVFPSPIPEIGSNIRHETSRAEPKDASLSGWWLAATILALLAAVLGVSDWRIQTQLDDIRDQAIKIKADEVLPGSSLQNGVFRVCNSSSEAIDVRQLAAAYWDANHNLRVFNSTAHTEDGWVVAPDSTQTLSWPLGQKSVWDGSVIFYSAKVQRGRKEFVITGRWDNHTLDCLHLPS